MSETKNTGEFVSIFDIHAAQQHEYHETFEDALLFLTDGSDKGLIMDIAIVEVKSKKMVWFQDFLSQEVCQNRVNDFLKQLEQ